MFLDITASHENRDTILDVVRAHRRGLLHAAHRRRRRAHRRGHPQAAGLRRRQGVDQHRGGGAARIREEAAEKFGDQCIVVAIDAKKVSQPGEPDRWEIFTHGGRNPTGLDAVDYAREVVALGAGEILLTSMDRDGTKTGYDIALTRAVADAVPVPVIASGGVGTLDHLVDGIRDGHATAVLAASIFHFGEFSVRQAKDAHGAGGPADAARSVDFGAFHAVVRAARLAQASARSSRSLPQNNSPSAVVKLGAPKMPSRCASSVCVRSRVLIASDCGGFEHGAAASTQLRQDFADGRRLVDPAASPNCARNTATENASPQPCVEPDQRDARRQQAVLRKRIGPAERHTQVRRTAVRGRATCSGPWPRRG